MDLAGTKTHADERPFKSKSLIFVCAGEALVRILYRCGALQTVRTRNLGHAEMVYRNPLILHLARSVSIYCLEDTTARPAGPSTHQIYLHCKGSMPVSNPSCRLCPDLKVTC